MQEFKSAKKVDGWVGGLWEERSGKRGVGDKGGKREERKRQELSCLFLSFLLPPLSPSHSFLQQHCLYDMYKPSIP
jgi:hypothetical protein